MKIYISGKITGLDIKHAEKLFSAAEQELISMGHEPVNPMKLPHEHCQTWHAFMKEDIAVLLECDGIYMLQNFWTSKGALLERYIAREMGMHIIIQPEIVNELTA